MLDIYHYFINGLVKTNHFFSHPSFLCADLFQRGKMRCFQPHFCAAGTGCIWRDGAVTC